MNHNYYKSVKYLLARLRGKIFTVRCKAFHRNVEIGTGLELRNKLEIRGPGRVCIGNYCVIAGIDGDNNQFVTLYTHSPNAMIQIGNNAKLFGTRISSSFSVHIGNDVLIEDSGISDTNFHSIDRNREPPKSETAEKCAVVIGDRVAIACRSIVAKGVRIGNDSLIGPGAIVTQSVPDMSFAMGNPAKVIKKC
jgi:acetyltransferase-like isoleucine patch superfamily enzyme